MILPTTAGMRARPDSSSAAASRRAWSTARVSRSAASRPTRAAASARAAPASSRARDRTAAAWVRAAATSCAAWIRASSTSTAQASTSAASAANTGTNSAAGPWTSAAGTPTGPAGPGVPAGLKRSNTLNRATTPPLKGPQGLILVPLSRLLAAVVTGFAPAMFGLVAGVFSTGWSTGSRQATRTASAPHSKKPLTRPGPAGPDRSHAPPSISTNTSDQPRMGHSLRRVAPWNGIPGSDKAKVRSERKGTPARCCWRSLLVCAHISWRRA